MRDRARQSRIPVERRTKRQPGDNDLLDCFRAVGIVEVDIHGGSDPYGFRSWRAPREGHGTRNRLNNNAQYIELDTRDFTAGQQTLTLTYEQGGALRPATGGYPFGLGPVVLAPAGDQALVTKVPASDYRQLCGQRLDWLEALE